MPASTAPARPGRTLHRDAGAARAGGTARRGRELEPAWARGLSPDEVMAEREARQLPTDTDPGSIDDDEVRDRFLARLHRVDAGDADEPSGPPGKPRSRRRAGAPGGRARFSHPLHWGSGSRGHVVGRPTLTPPRRLSASDGTGFLFGVFLYAMGINYLRYGPHGITSWLSAKFLNKPTLVAGPGGGVVDPNLAHLLNPNPPAAAAPAPPTLGGILTPGPKKAP